MGNIPGVPVDWPKVEYYMHIKGLSQRKLAAALGSAPDQPMSEQTIRNWKRGVKLPNVKSFSRLASVLEVYPHEIMLTDNALSLAPEDKQLRAVYAVLDKLDRELSMLSYAGYQCTDKFLVDWPGKDRGISAHEYLQGIAEKLKSIGHYEDKDREKWRSARALNDFYLDEAVPDDLQLIYEIRQPDGNIICVSADNLRAISRLIRDSIASSFKNAANNLETPPGNASIYAD